MGCHESGSVGDFQVPRRRCVLSAWIERRPPGHAIYWGETSYVTFSTKVRTYRHRGAMFLDRSLGRTGRPDYESHGRCDPNRRRAVHLQLLACVDPNSTLGAAQFFLEVSPTANLAAVSAPSGWASLLLGGRPRHFFPLVGPFDRCRAGNVRRVFVHQHDRPVSWRLPCTRLRDDGSVGENTGMILAPASVPEPSSLLLGVLGVAGAAVWCRTRRRPKA